MIVLFCRSKTISSWLIRQFTWSDYSHVAILEPDGDHVIEARWPEVRMCHLADVISDNHVVTAVDIPCADPQSAILWAWNQVGKPYDLLALFAFLFHRRNWISEGKWFCSELVAVAWAHGKSPLFQPDSVTRVTPGMLWDLPHGDAK